MKKVLIFAFAAAALLASCVKEVPVNEEQNGVPTIKETVVFSANFVETKTAFGALADGKYPNLWSAGDKISVNGVVSSEVEAEAVGTSSATFEVENVGEPYNIAYPAAAVSNYTAGAANIALPAEQAWVEGTYDPAAMIMIAKTNETTFTLNPAMAIVRITPTTALGGIKSIKVKANGGEKLAGAFTTDFEAIAPADGAADEVVVKAAAAVAAGKDWFIAIPAGNYQANGFQVTFTDASDNQIVKLAAPTKAYAAGHVYTLSMDAFPAELTVKGHDAIVNFANNTPRSNFEKLVIDGNNETVADSEMANLKLAINEVADITFQNIKGWTMVEQVILAGDFRVTPTGSIRFINCPNLNNINGLKWMTKVNGDLIFKDCPNIPWNWGATNCCNQITEVTGDFTIDNAATALTGATCLASLKKVGGNLTITNCNAGFWNLDGMPLEEIGGNFTYVDNALVNSFIGFAGLTNIGGNLLVKGTAIEDFTQVQTWITNGILKGTAECWNGANKVDFTLPVEPVIIKGHDAFVNFANNTPRSNFEKLIIDGNNETITDSEMASVKLAINEVADITFQNIKGWSMVEQVILAGDFRVTPTGSIRFINCPNLNNINGLKWMTKVNGDLIFKDCPNIPWNWGATNCCNQITEVTGDFTIDNAATALTGATCLASLKKVGGNLTITNCNAGFWNLDGMPLEEIGGNFTYVDNALVNSFIGFAGLTKIGGNLLVKGTAIEDFTQVQTWITNGVLKGTAECWNGSTKVTFE